MLLPRQNEFRPGVVVLFDDTITNIGTAPHVDDRSGEQPGYKIWSANESLELVHRIRTGKCLEERDKLRGTKS